MAFSGGDFGLSEFIYQKLNRFRKYIPRRAKRTVATFILNTVLIFSVAGPVMTIPQVAKIYTEHAAAGLSLLTWSAYLFIAFFWLNYGLLIRNRPIVLANACGMVVHTLTIIGIVLYNGI